MISLCSVTKEYRVGQQVVITPVKDVSLEVTAGEFIMIVGRSGTGKSTLLNLMAGLIQPTTGKVLIDKVDLGGMSDKEISKLRSRKIGFVFQFPSLLPSLTVQENVAMPTIFTSQKVACQDCPIGRCGDPPSTRAAELLNKLGLADKLEVYPKQLSAGEQKRAVIARSLINQPQILLADEPTSDLDEMTEKEVMALLKEINASGVTLLMVTHSLHLLPYATRAFRMENGSMLPLSTTGDRVPL